MKIKWEFEVEYAYNDKRKCKPVIVIQFYTTWFIKLMQNGLGDNKIKLKLIKGQMRVIDFFIYIIICVLYTVFQFFHLSKVSF